MYDRKLVRYSVGSRVRDNLTGLRGTVVRTRPIGVEMFLDLNHRTRRYTWAEAYQEFAAGHPRLELLPAVEQAS